MLARREGGGGRGKEHHDCWYACWAAREQRGRTGADKAKPPSLPPLIQASGCPGPSLAWLHCSARPPAHQCRQCALCVLLSAAAPEPCMRDAKQPCIGGASCPCITLMTSAEHSPTMLHGMPGRWRGGDGARRGQQTHERQNACCLKEPAGWVRLPWRGETSGPGCPRVGRQAHARARRQRTWAHSRPPARTPSCHQRISAGAASCVQTPPAGRGGEAGREDERQRQCRGALNAAAACDW